MKHKKMDFRLNFWVDESTRQALTQYALDRDISYSEAARQILRENLGRRDKLSELEFRISRLEHEVLDQ